jgi:uncharacterized membrane protein YkoI
MTSTKLLAGLGVAAALALGGAALAGAASNDESEGGPSVAGSDAARARDAAVARTGGTAGHVERDGENGATYEVEVTKPDGSRWDVRLDDTFKIVVVESDGESSGSDD